MVWISQTLCSVSLPGWPTLELILMSGYMRMTATNHFLLFTLSVLLESFIAKVLQQELYLETSVLDDHHEMKLIFLFLFFFPFFHATTANCLQDK